MPYALKFDVLCQHKDILGNKFNLFFRNCINILVFVNKDSFFLHISINIYFIYSYIYIKIFSVCKVKCI